MGTLNYAVWSVEFDDQTLAHLQVVIVNKFRRGESFLMSWVDAVAMGDGRSSIWLTPAVPVYFKFNGSRVPTLQEGWLHQLNSSASASTGLIVTDVDGTPIHAGAQRGSPHLPRPRAHRVH